MRGYHIHHFATGFLMLIAACLLFSKRIFSDYIPLALIGSALALIFDEFLFWSRGHFNYWSEFNLAATVIIGIIILLVHLLVKHDSSGHLSKKRIFSFAIITIFFSGALFLIFHYDRLILEGGQPKNPITQDYNDSSTINQ